MSATPPAVGVKEFQEVNIIDEDEIKRRFSGFVRALHDYLNALPCLRDIQQVRKKWKAHVTSPNAFGNLATEPRHWYTFHHGGRTEAQFNMGLFTTHLRVGMGFEFSMKKGGDPTQVQLVYACFTNLIRGERREFEQFVARHRLQVEWLAKDGSTLVFVPTEEAVEWLLAPPREPSWVFVGRLLRRGQDSAVLGDPAQLSEVIDTVFGGLRPLWERTHVMASTI